jgi:hypothetical protein
MPTMLRFGALLFFFTLVSSVGLAQVVQGPPADPGFAYEDFNNNGLYDAGVDLKLDLPENWNFKTKNSDISIWNSDAGWDAMAGIVIPKSCHRLDASAYTGSNVFIYTQGVLRLGHGLVVRADSIEITGDGGVYLDAVTMNGGAYLNINGPLHADACVLRANYLITYGRELTHIDRSRVVGDQFCTVTADQGKLELTRSVLKAGWIVSTRGEMHGDALSFNAPEVDIYNGDETGSVGHVLTRTSVVVGPSGIFNLATGWGEDPKPIDFSRSAVTGSYYTVYFYGSPCLVDKGAFRGTSPNVTMAP